MASLDWWLWRPKAATADGLFPKWLPKWLNALARDGFTVPEYVLLPHRQEFPGWSFPESRVGMTFLRTQSSGALGGGAGSQNLVADADSGDSRTYNVCVAAGTYTLRFMWVSFFGGAICTTLFDAVSLGDVDMYTAGVVNNNVTTVTGIVVSAGNHTITFLASSKNELSSDFMVSLQWVSLDRTGA